MISSETAKSIKSGATIRVFEKVPGRGGSSSGGKEGDKERTTQFEGLVLARKHGMEAGATFTVRATIAGVGVEKVFPIHSPLISKVDIISSPRKVSRSKIYYVRNLSRKATRQKMGTGIGDAGASNSNIVEKPVVKSAPEEKAE